MKETYYKPFANLTEKFFVLADLIKYINREFNPKAASKIKKELTYCDMVLVPETPHGKEIEYVRVEDAVTAVEKLYNDALVNVSPNTYLEIAKNRDNAVRHLEANLVNVRWRYDGHVWSLRHLRPGKSKPDTRIENAIAALEASLTQIRQDYLTASDMLAELKEALKK